MNYFYHKTTLLQCPFHPLEIQFLTTQCYFDEHISNSVDKYKNACTKVKNIKYRWVVCILIMWLGRDDLGHWNALNYVFRTIADEKEKKEALDLFEKVKKAINKIIKKIKLEKLENEQTFYFQHGYVTEGMNLQKQIMAIKNRL